MKIEIHPKHQDTYLGMYNGCEHYGLMATWDGEKEDWICQIHESSSCVGRFYSEIFHHKVSRPKMWLLNLKYRIFSESDNTMFKRRF